MSSEIENQQKENMIENPLFDNDNKLSRLQSLMVSASRPILFADKNDETLLMKELAERNVVVKMNKNIKKMGDESYRLRLIYINSVLDEFKELSKIDINNGLPKIPLPQKGLSILKIKSSLNDHIYKEIINLYSTNGEIKEDVIRAIIPIIEIYDHTEKMLSGGLFGTLKDRPVFKTPRLNKEMTFGNSNSRLVQWTLIKKIEIYEEIFLDLYYRLVILSPKFYNSLKNSNNNIVKDFLSLFGVHFILNDRIVRTNDLLCLLLYHEYVNKEILRLSKFILLIETMSRENVIDKLKGRKENFVLTYMKEIAGLNEFLLYYNIIFRKNVKTNSNMNQNTLLDKQKITSFILRTNDNLIKECLSDNFAFTDVRSYWLRTLNSFLNNYLGIARTMLKTVSGLTSLLQNDLKNFVKEISENKYESKVPLKSLYLYTFINDVCKSNSLILFSLLKRDYFSKVKLGESPRINTNAYGMIDSPQKRINVNNDKFENAKSGQTNENQTEKQNGQEERQLGGQLGKQLGNKRSKKAKIMKNKKK